MLKNYLKYHIYTKFSVILSNLFSSNSFVSYKKNFDINLLKEFKKNGYLIFNNVIDTKELNIIKTEMNEYLSNNRVEDSNAVAYKREVAEVFEGRFTEVISNFIKKNYIMGLIEKYLESKFLITNLVVKVNNPTKDKMGPSNFHKDTYKHKSVHIMVYLTDVDENGGCFTYIAGSNKQDLRSFKPQPIKKRITDEEILSHYDQISWLKGKAGSIIIVDANGLHAGPRWVDQNSEHNRSRTCVFINFSTLPLDKKLRLSFKEKSQLIQKRFSFK